MGRILLGLIPGCWVAAIAILSVQNAPPVQLQFLGLRSIEMPVGVAMGFCAAVGMATTAIFIALFSRRNSRR